MIPLALVIALIDELIDKLFQIGMDDDDIEKIIADRIRKKREQQSGYDGPSPF